MASAELSRRVEKVVGYPPLSELDAAQRREFHEALLDAGSFGDLPGMRSRCTLWQAGRIRMAQDERKPIPTRAELVAKLKSEAAARKQQHKESQAPPPSRPDPSQDAPPPGPGSRGW